MKAMILAAGLGTRLRPLTDDRPKALVEVAGRTLLELTLMRLRDFGIHEVIINTHHFADQVAEYLRVHQNFGMHIEISYEEVLLDTGGGIKRAAHFFLGSDEPFLVHNVDVISTIDFSRMTSVPHASAMRSALSPFRTARRRDIFFSTKTTSSVAAERVSLAKLNSFVPSRNSMHLPSPGFTSSRHAFFLS